MDQTRRTIVTLTQVYQESTFMTVEDAQDRGGSTINKDISNNVDEVRWCQRSLVTTNYSAPSVSQRADTLLIAIVKAPAPGHLVEGRLEGLKGPPPAFVLVGSCRRDLASAINWSLVQESVSLILRG